MDLAGSVSSCSVLKSQASRGTVAEDSDEDSDELFLSPLPPSPPPVSSQIKTRVEIQLPEAVIKADVFLSQFRSPNRDLLPSKMESTTTPSSSSSTHEAVVRNSESELCTPLKNKIFTSSKDDSGNTSTKPDYRSPMFENRISQAPALRSALSPIVSNHDNSEDGLLSQQRRAFVATGLIYSQMVNKKSIY